MVRVLGVLLGTLLLIIGFPFSSRSLSAFEPVAEQLFLKNGDRISGRSLNVEDSHLSFEMLYGEELAIPLDQIDRLEFFGEGSPDLAPLVIPDAAAQAAVEAEIRQAQQFLDEEGEPQFYRPRFGEMWDNISDQAYSWTKRIGLGTRYLQGNSDELFADFSAEFERRFERRFTQIKIWGAYGEAKGVRGTNRWFGNSTTDYTVRGNWVFFTKIMDQYDEFQNLDYRGTYSAGPGYRFLDQDKKRLIVRVGPTVMVEIFHSPITRRVTPDLFGELEVRWPLSQRMQFEQTATLQPGIVDSDQMRANSNTGVIVALDDAECWNLKLGFQYQYNGQPNPGRVPSDYSTQLQIVYQRK